MLIKKNYDYVFLIFLQYIRSLVSNFEAFLPNEYNFIFIYKKKKNTT